MKTYLLEKADKYLLSEDIKEYYTAAYICDDALQKTFNKELIPLFDKFRSDYPNSLYTPYIQTYIDPIISYHKIVSAPFSPSIRLADNMESIHSLKEAVVPYKGKKVFIDVWATWCGPCKQEFKHNDALKKLLKEKDIEMLYISIDGDQDSERWEQMIKYYNLEGNHIRTNDKLDADLRLIYDQDDMLMIPWYILINENGEIQELHCTPPSQIDELAKAL